MTISAESPASDANTLDAALLAMLEIAGNDPGQDGKLSSRGRAALDFIAETVANPGSDAAMSDKRKSTEEKVQAPTELRGWRAAHQRIRQRFAATNGLTCKSFTGDSSVPAMRRQAKNDHASDPKLGNDMKRVELMADILGGLLGEKALLAFAGENVADMPGDTEKAYGILRLDRDDWWVTRKAWNELQHPRGKGGRFIKKGSAESIAAAKVAIRQALRDHPQAGAPEYAQSLAEHLSILTVSQLHELKKEYGLQASGKLKEQLIAKLVDRLPGAQERMEKERKLAAAEVGLDKDSSLEDIVAEVARQAGYPEHFITREELDEKLSSLGVSVPVLRGEAMAHAFAMLKDGVPEKKVEPQPETKEETVPGMPPKEPAAGKVYNVATNELHVDPERFQYKLNTDKTSGVGQELKAVRTWNPDFAGVVSVWRDPESGKDFVVNGHHRRELAGRLGVDDMAVRYITAKNAKEARAAGALINIAEGRGTAIDAAKFMRDSGVGIEDMESHGVSLRGKLAADAATLTRLSDRAFDNLARGTLDETKALAVAKHLDDHALQDQLFGLLEKRENEGKDLSPRVIEEMARAMAETPKTKTTEHTLFGDIESEESLFVPRAEVASAVRAGLAKEVNDWLAVSSKRRAERVGGAGNVLNVEENKKVAEQAEQVKNVFDQLANRKGAISEALNAAAEDYHKAKSKKEREHVKQRALESVRDAVLKEAGFGESERAGIEHGQADTGGETTSLQGGGGAGEAQSGAGTEGVSADGGRGDVGEAGLTANINFDSKVDALARASAYDKDPSRKHGFPVDTNPPYRRIAPRADDVKKAPIVEVPLNELIATQRGVSPGKLKEKNSEGSDKPIIVVRAEGKLYIDDGTHQATLAKLRGEERVKARIFDYDSEKQRPVPALAEEAESIGAAGLKPPEPGFTGIDANGHQWVNGEQVKREEESSAGELKPAASPHSEAKISAALSRYANRAQTARGGGIFGGEDLQAREGFAKLPDNAPIVFTEGEFQGKTGKIVHDNDPATGKPRIVAAVDGRDGLVPISPEAIEPLDAHLSWRVEGGGSGVGGKQSGLFGGTAPAKQTEDVHPDVAEHRAIMGELNAMSREGKTHGEIRGVKVERKGAGDFVAEVNGKKVHGDLGYVASRIQEAKFTGIDANGHEWVNGKQVTRGEQEQGQTGHGAATEQEPVSGERPGAVSESIGGGNSGGSASGDAGAERSRSAGPRIVTARAEHTRTGNPALVPASIRGHLNDAQQQGAALAIEAMTKHGGFLLADGTGVGKTRQEIAVAQNFLEQGKKVVIVSPAEVIKPDWKKGTMSGSFANDSAAMGVAVKLTKGDGEITPGTAHITTYNELGKLKGKIDKDTVVIFDESHFMKNSASARAKAGKDICDNAGAVMYATATAGDKPLHIAHLVRAGVFGNVGKTETYQKLGMRLVDQHIGGGRYQKVWQIDPKVGYTEAARRMSGLFDQMTKDGLMVKRELAMDNVAFQTDRVAFSDDQHEAVRQVYQQKLNETRSAAMPNGNKAVALMHARLHQEPFKIPAIVDMVKDELASGRSPIVFLGRISDIGTDDDEVDEVREGAFSAGTAAKLKEALIAAGVPESQIGELHGGATKTADAKKKAMEKFQSGKSRVMIATVQSGGTGINLDDTTGERPRTVIMMTPPFTANDMAQAIGRVHRLNTKSESKVRGVLADTHIDDWNAGILETKFKMLGAVVGGESTRGRGAIAAPEGLEEDRPQEPFTWGESLHQQPKFHRNTPYAHNDIIGQFGGKRVKQGGDWTTQFPSEEHYERYRQHVAPKPTPKPQEPVASRAAEQREEPPTPPISAARKEAIHQALRQLHGANQDRARERNDVGFNQFDSDFGGKLAESPTLTDRQAEAGAKLLAKYRRQLGDELHGKVTTPDKPEATKPVSPAATEPPETSVPIKRVQTSRGERSVHSFSPSSSFWDARRAGKLPDNITVRENDRTGQWEASIWGANGKEIHDTIEKLRAKGVRV